MAAHAKLRPVWWAALGAGLAVVGCGGGGAGGGSSVPPPVATAVASAPVVSGGLRLVVPLAGAQSSRRNPAWVSPSVQSVHVVVNNVGGAGNVQDYDVSATSPNCTTSAGARTCILTFGAPPGVDTFAITLYDGPVVAGKASGTVLGNGNATQTVVLGSAFNVAITAAGIAKTVTVAVSPANFTAGTPTTAAVTVTVSDASNTVVAGPYANPVNLSTTDTTGAFSLSSTSITYGKTVTLSYNGSTNITSATINASVGSASAGASVNVIGGSRQLTAVPIPLPTSTTYAQLWDLTVASDGGIWTVSNGGASAIRVDPNGAAPGSVVSTLPTSRLIGITSLNGVIYWFGGVSPTALVGPIPASLTPSPTITLPPNSQAAYITAGPDQNLWGIDEGTNRVARITPAGVVTEFAVAGLSGTPMSANAHITQGPDGAMWLTAPEANSVARMTTAGVTTAVYPLPTPSGFSLDTVYGNVHGIATGPDGNLWVTEAQTGRITRITPTGVITPFNATPALQSPEAIVAGQDGNLWFTNIGSGLIGKVSTSGQIGTFFLNAGTAGTLKGYGIVSSSNGLYTTVTLPGGQPGILKFAPQ